MWGLAGHFLLCFLKFYYDRTCIWCSSLYRCVCLVRNIFLWRIFLVRNFCLRLVFLLLLLFYFSAPYLFKSHTVHCFQSENIFTATFVYIKLDWVRLDGLQLVHNLVFNRFILDLICISVLAALPGLPAASRGVKLLLLSDTRSVFQSQ